MTKSMEELVFDKLIAGYEAKIAELEGNVRVLATDNAMWQDRCRREEKLSSGYAQRLNAAERPILELYEAADYATRVGAKGFEKLRAALKAAKEHVSFIPF